MRRLEKWSVRRYDYRPLIRKVLMEYVNKEALQLLAGVAEDKREAAGKAA